MLIVALGNLTTRSFICQLHHHAACATVDHRVTSIAPQHQHLTMVKPPKSAGAMLSAWYPLTAASAFKPASTSLSLGTGHLPLQTH